jgi:hypothetical protein
LNEKVAAPVKKTELTTGGGGIGCADHTTPSIRKNLALTLPTSGGRSVGIVRLRTEDHGVYPLFSEELRRCCSGAGRQDIGITQERAAG